MFLPDPFMVVLKVLVVTCSAHMWGNTCDEDAKCMDGVGNMIACYIKYQSPIQTPVYKEALRRGHNPPFVIRDRASSRRNQPGSSFASR